MAARNRFGSQERAARSRLAQLLHGQDMICGSVVSMARTCGKAGCRCARGEKHVSLYLSVKMEGRRRMVYIPPELEQEVRRCVAAWREAEALTQTVSAACLGRVLERKGKGKSDGGRQA
jgi:hypothetical protein